MNLIVAALLWMGAIQPGQTPSDQMIRENREAIVCSIQDPDFIREHQNITLNRDHIGMLDLNEGD
jgi:hypothetical protein